MTVEIFVAVFVVLVLCVYVVLHGALLNRIATNLTRSPHYLRSSIVAYQAFVVLPLHALRTLCFLHVSFCASLLVARFPFSLGAVQFLFGVVLAVLVDIVLLRGGLSLPFPCGFLLLPAAPLPVLVAFALGHSALSRQPEMQR